MKAIEYLQQYEKGEKYEQVYDNQEEVKKKLHKSQQKQSQKDNKARNVKKIEAVQVLPDPLKLLEMDEISSTVINIPTLTPRVDFEEQQTELFQDLGQLYGVEFDDANYPVS